MVILQSIILGIPQGALYGLMGFGIALIFRSAGVLNFAHGTLIMICVYISFTMLGLTKNLYISVLSSIVAGLCLGFLIDKFLMRPIKHISHGGMLMITLGLLMVLDGLSTMIWGNNYQSYPAISNADPIFIGEGTAKIVLPANDIVIAAIALGVSVILALFMKKTKAGIAIQARGQDEIGACVVGIDTNKTDSLVWGIGIGVGAIVGVLVAPETYIHPNMMTNMQLYGITAGVVGGFSSLFGAIWGGLILGVLQKLISSVISPDYQLTIIFFLIIIILAIKPSGLFSKNTNGRV